MGKGGRQKVEDNLYQKKKKEKRNKERRVRFMYVTLIFENPEED
jgi:hypothetical protein